MLAGPSALVLLLLPLLVLGGMAAVVFGIVYAIANKRPGVAVASILLPLAFVFGVAVLFFLAIPRHGSPVVQISHGDNGVQEWPSPPAVPQVAISNPPMPPMPAMPAMPAAPQFNVGGGLRLSWMKLALIAAICIIVAKILRKRDRDDSERHTSWGKLIVVGVLLFLAANFLVLQASRVPAPVAQSRVDAPRESSGENVSHQIKNAEIKTIKAQAKSGPVRDQAANQWADGASIQELWEKLNQPRIKLDSDQRGVKVTMGDGANQVAVVAPEKGGAQPIDETSDNSPESLARSLTRLERMVEQVTAVADRLSDAGTLIGKGMIALSDTAASRPSATSEETATKSHAAEADWPATSPAPVVQAAVAEAKVATPPVIEINFDQQKMKQFNLSYAKIRDSLGRDRFWRGTTVRFVPSESRIVVTGDIAKDYESRVGRALVGTAGRQRRPIHLSDVATILATSENLAHDATGHEAGNSARPAWVDEPPKNIGNVRRQVIVAGDFVTVDECNREMDRQLYLATFQRLVELTGESDRNLLSSVSDRDGLAKINPAYLAAIYLNRMGIGIDFIRREIAKKEYVATVDRSVGPMKQLYVQVEFSSSIDNELRRRWDEVRRQDRFAVVGVGASSVLGLMGLMFGLLKVDTWTKGYYTKRLFFGVPAAIIGGFGLLVLFMETIGGK